MLASEAKKWPHQTDPLGEFPGPGHARQPGEARSPENAMEDRLGLIIEGMPNSHMPRPKDAG